jgi:hypothetical protein
MLMPLPARCTLHKAQVDPERTGHVCSTYTTHTRQTEFDAAFLRLQERCEPLSKEQYKRLTNEQREWLAPLEDDCAELKRRDQEILRDHALSRGIDLGRAVYLKRAPVIYMSRLLVQLGYGSLEAVYQEYPHLKSGAVLRR